MPPSAMPSSVIVLTPSRGLIHSRTVEATLAAVNAARDETTRVVGWLITHDLPIPDCHETLAARGMATGADYLWYVEEDMLPPPESLCALLDVARATGAGVVTLDYPVGEPPRTQSVITYHPSGGVWWCGLGCTLIARSVFDRLARPWFDSSRVYAFTQPGVITPQDGVPYRYGGQDVTFCLAARAAGIPIAVVPATTMTAGHARLRSLGASGDNHGAHVIDLLTQMER